MENFKKEIWPGLWKILVVILTATTFHILGKNNIIAINGKASLLVGCIIGAMLVVATESVVVNMEKKYLHTFFQFLIGLGEAISRPVRFCIWIKSIPKEGQLMSIGPDGRYKHKT